MATIINPLGAMYSVSVNDIGDKSSSLTKAMANNVNSDISTFHSIFSRQLNAAALRGSHIVENLGIGYNLASTALSTLNSLSEQLDTIKNTIMSLDNASPQLLDIEEENYTSQVRRIFDTLANTDFNGKKLFDGTLANAPAVRLPSQNLPDNAGSLLIETSINSQSYVNITIPRMLSGDGTIVNAPVDGVFDPLFPVTENTRSALAKLDAVVHTATNTDTTAGLGGWNGITGTTGLVIGSYGDQQHLIEAALPLGVNAEQDMVRSTAIEAFRVLARSYGTPEDSQAAASALRYAKAVAKTITLSSTDAALVTAASNVIQIAVNSTAGTDKPGGRNVIAAIPDGPTTPYLQRSLKLAALEVYDANSGAPDGYQQASPIMTFVNNIISGAKNYLVAGGIGFDNNIQSRSFPNPIYIGSIKTLSGRAGAMKIIDNAIRSINTASAQITGQRDIIVTNTGVLKQNIIDLIKSADSISSADYEKIVPKLTELLRSVTVLSVAFGLEEEFIDTITNRLEFIGNQE